MEKFNQPTLSFLNDEFINSDEGRSVRILSEYLFPEHHFKEQKIEKSIVIFGSARILSMEQWKEKNELLKEQFDNANPISKEELSYKIKKHKEQEHLSKIYEECVLLSEMLVDWSLKLPKDKQFYICTGGGPGFMEAGNKGAFNKKMPSISLNITLPHEQHPNPFTTNDLNFSFHYFFMRKLWFTSLAQALIAMPGGFGTLDELAEHLTLIQTRKITKSLPIVLYNEDFWRKTINFDYLAECGMIDNDDLFLFKFCSTPDDAFKYITDRLTKTNKL